MGILSHLKRAPLFELDDVMAGIGSQRKRNVHGQLGQDCVASRKEDTGAAFPSEETLALDANRLERGPKEGCSRCVQRVIPAHSPDC
jgi:hypothetical protein